jgi:hypothetical protein
VLGSVLILVSLGLLGAGGTALWLDLSHRGSDGYVTTGTHAFAAEGSALVTGSIKLGSPGVDWLYSEFVFGEVRIRVTPTQPSASVFVGVGRAPQVTRYLSGVAYTIFPDFWWEQGRSVDGDATAAPPGTQDLWVESVAGEGIQTLTWEPGNGSWAVVVMNEDGSPGVDVSLDVGATLPWLMPMAIGTLVFGLLFLIGGVALIVGAVRRSRR